MSTTDRHERFGQPTVDLVAKVLPYALPPASRQVARHVLNALADAGLLLPPQARDAYRVVYGVDRLVVWSEHWDRPNADAALIRARAPYPDARMQHRLEFETPWTEVPQ